MCVHKTECKYNNSMFLKKDIYPVHSGFEIILAGEDFIDSIAIGREMPAIPYGEGTALDEAKVQAEVMLDLPHNNRIKFHNSSIG